MYFAEQAKAAHIKYTVTADLMLEVGIPDEVLTVVLGNLLENAIAACKEEPGPTRLNAHARKDDSVVFFHISNTCTRQRVQDKDGRYLSTKADGQGIGLNSVRNIAKQYDGMMEITQKDDTFSVSVMLTIPDDFE